MLIELFGVKVSSEMLEDAIKQSSRGMWDVRRCDCVGLSSMLDWWLATSSSRIQLYQGQTSGRATAGNTGRSLRNSLTMASLSNDDAETETKMLSMMLETREDSSRATKLKVVSWWST